MIIYAHQDIDKEMLQKAGIDMNSFEFIHDIMLPAGIYYVSTRKIPPQQKSPRLPRKLKKKHGREEMKYPKLTENDKIKFLDKINKLAKAHAEHQHKSILKRLLEGE